MVRPAKYAPSQSSDAPNPIAAPIAKSPASATVNPGSSSSGARATDGATPNASASANPARTIGGTDGCENPGARATSPAERANTSHAVASNGATSASREQRHSGDDLVEQLRAQLQPEPPENHDHRADRKDLRQHRQRLFLYLRRRLHDRDARPDDGRDDEHRKRQQRGYEQRIAQQLIEPIHALMVPRQRGPDCYRRVITKLGGRPSGRRRRRGWPAIG